LISFLLADLTLSSPPPVVTFEDYANAMERARLEVESQGLPLNIPEDLEKSELEAANAARLLEQFVADLDMTDSSVYFGEGEHYSTASESGVDNLNHIIAAQVFSNAMSQDENCDGQTSAHSNRVLSKREKVCGMLLWLLFFTVTFYILVKWFFPDCKSKVEMQKNSTEDNIISLFGVNYEQTMLDQSLSRLNSTAKGTAMCRNILPVLWKSNFPQNYWRNVELEIGCTKAFYLGMNYFISICDRRGRKPRGVVLNQYKINDENIFYGSLNRIELTWEQFCSLHAISWDILIEIEKLFFPDEYLDKADHLRSKEVEEHIASIKETAPNSTAIVRTEAAITRKTTED
jgi:hypothetical protein